jgi:Transposase DDE domain
MSARWAPHRVLLDAGYMGIELLSRLAEREINVLCPSGRTNSADWQRRKSGAYFDKREFVYEPQHDRSRGPAGRELLYEYRAPDRRGRQFVRYRGAQCGGCELRTQCTASASGRTLRRYAGEELKEAMAEVLRQPAARREHRRRKVLVEPVFARLRGLQRLDRFRRRGLDAVRTEFALHCIAYNLRVAAHLILSRIFLIILRASPDQPPRLLVAPIFLTSIQMSPFIDSLLFAGEGVVRVPKKSWLLQPRHTMAIAMRTSSLSSRGSRAGIGPSWSSGYDCAADSLAQNSDVNIGSDPISSISAASNGG